MPDDDIVYPTADDIHAIHEAIVDSDPDASTGVRAPDAAESAITYISEGYFGQVPETIHEKAAHLMRLLVADHSYVDANKRTALATTSAFYWQNGYYFDYPDEEIRSTLQKFARGAESVDIDCVITDFEEYTIPKEEISEDDVRRAMARIVESNESEQQE